MRYSVRIPLLLTLCAFGSPALAGGIIDIVLDREVAPWPANFTAKDNFKSIQMADLDGDGPADGLVLVGTELVFLPNLDDYTAPDMLLDGVGQPIVCNDVKLLAPPSSGGVGAAVSVGPAGLQVLRWNPATSAIEIESTVGGAWLDARKLEVVDWDGDGVEDVIALGATFDQVLVRLSPEANGVDGAPINLALPASDLIPVQWAENDSLGFAVLNGLGLEVRNHAGAVVYTRGTPLPSGSFARIQTAASVDTIVWFAGPNGNGDSFVVSIDNSGVTGVLPVVGLGANKTIAGDYDGDGDTDFALSFTNSTDLWMVEWDGLGVSSSSTVLRLDGGPTFGSGLPGGNPATPLMADSNWDGNLDILIPMQSEPGIVILHGDAVWSPVLALSDERRISGFSLCIDSVSDNGLLSASFDYDTAGLVGFAEFEVTVWLQPDINSYVYDDAISNCASPAGVGTVHDVDLVIPDYAFDASVSGSQLLIFYGTVTPVDAGGVSVGPAIHGAFSVDLSVAVTLFDSIGAAGAMVEMVDLTITCGEINPGAQGPPLGGPIVSGGSFGSRRRGPHVPTKRPNKTVTCKKVHDTVPPQ